MAQFGNTSARLDVGQVAVLEMWHTQGTQASVQRLPYVVAAGVGTGVSYAEFLTFMNTVWGPLWPVMYTSLARFNGLLVREILAATVTPIAPAWDTGAAAVGIFAGGPGPSQVSGIISTRTAVGGRKGRGRVYVPFPGQVAYMANGEPTAAYITLVTALASAWVAPQIIVGAGGSVSLVPSLRHRATGLTTALLTAYPKPVWATQRRRGDYGRANVSPF